MARNPRGDWTIADVEVVCRHFGLDRQAPPHGSHYVVSHPMIEGLLTLPSRRRIKPLYIKLLVDLIACSLEIR